MSATPPAMRHFRPALFLDYGADAIDAETAACEICERGMRFHSPWRFDIGAELQIAIAWDDSTSQRIQAQGLVIECTKGASSLYQTTLAFVEAPQELRASLGKVSSRLSAPSRDRSPISAEKSGR